MTRPTLDEVMEACEADDNIGFCIECGEEAYGIEPDARKYKCESCGALAVFGAEEILIAGLYDDSDA
jgi:DNA-directed RNA polymerase subunit RPC12/RpoP